MNNNELRALLAGERADALSASKQTKLSQERTDALKYYNGDMSKDLPAQPGRSSAVSLDVSDTVEGMLPQIMDTMLGSNEVVRFEPVGPEDVQAAEQESDYVNHVFMQLNDGWMTAYTMFKDALLSKLGVVKVFWERREVEQREHYFDKTDDEYALLASNPEIEIIEHTSRPAGAYGEGQSAPVGDGIKTAPAYLPLSNGPDLQGGGGQLLQPPMLHDVTVVTRKDYSCTKVVPIPPEEFGTRSDTRIIKESNYCYHEVKTTVGKAIGQGYDPKQIKNLPTRSVNDNPEEIARDTVNETGVISSEMNPMTREILITEHYVRMDYEGDGKERLYRVVTGGEQGEILRWRATDDDAFEDDIQEWDAMPFAAVTPIPQTHRLYGQSFADKTMDIQRIKTALVRGALDNTYLALNPRVEVSEQHQSDNTLDDLLISRPGGIVRTRQPGGINWQVVPNMASAIFPVLEYMDTIKESRTGFSNRSQGLDANALANQSATSANIAYSVSQMQIKMVCKIFAETGFKDIFWLIHMTEKKHAQKQKMVRLRNQWVPVDPRNWKSRDDLTVHVGLGTGDKAQQMAMLNVIAMMQEKLLLGGMTNLVGPQQIYNTAKDYTRLMSKPDTETYFTDPSKQPPAQPQVDPKVMEIQMKNELEMKKAQVDAAHQAAKLQADATLEQQKFQHDRELALLKAQLDMAEASHSQKIAERKAAIDEHVATRKLEIDGVRASHDIARKNAENERDAAEAAKPDMTAELLARIDAQHQQQIEHNAMMMKALTAPKRVVRHPKTGKAEGVETVLQ